MNKKNDKDSLFCSFCGKNQKEVKKTVEKVGGRTVDIRFAEDKRGKVHVYIDGMSMGDPYINMKKAEKEMKNIKNV